MTFRALVVLGVSLVAGGCSIYSNHGHPMYEGPERPRAETAVLDYAINRHVVAGVMSIDGTQVPMVLQQGPFSLLPGKHLIASWTRVNERVYGGALVTTCRTYVTFQAEAGKHYLLDHPAPCEVELFDRDTKELLERGSDLYIRSP